jgi:hypothetical protein
VQCDGAGNTAALDAWLSSNGGASATDACGGVSWSNNFTSLSNLCGATGAATVIFTATDDCGNTSTTSATFTIYDDIGPSVTCPTPPVGGFLRNTNTGVCTYKVVGTEFNATASDICSGSATLAWCVTNPNAATQTGNTSLANTDLSFGVNTIKWMATDACGNTSTCSFTVNVNKVTTTTTVTVTPNTSQYSDKVTFVATVTPYNCAGAGDIGGTVTFKVGTQSVGTAPVINGVATLANVALLEPVPYGTSPTGQMAPTSPGTRTVTADFSGTDPDYSVTDPTTVLTITKENADVTYSGLSYFSTSSSSSCVATITLSATIKDITALGGADTDAGDIRNATVTFRLGSPTGTILGTPNIPVVLVSPGNTMVGTASTTFNYTLSSTDCANKGTTLDVYAVVNNYYTGDNSLDPGNVTISVPGSESVTGGGYLIMQNSIGTYAGTTGKKTNFGFTMKWNKSGTNVKGQCNIIIRKDNKVYQIKSNAINSLAVSGSNGNFSTKANLRDITDPLNPISLGGNLDLFVNMYDGSPGGQLDSISIQLQQGSTILYSSHWNGTKTVRRLLDGGNVQVRQSTPPTNTYITRSVEMETTPEISPFNVKAFPNPTEHQFTLYLEGGTNEKVQMVVYDAVGRIVKKMERGDASGPIKFGEDLKVGVYIVEVRQGENRKTLKLVKQ